jgi:hypothetical protein
MKTLVRFTFLAALVALGGCASAPKTHEPVAALDFARFDTVAVAAMSITPEAVEGLSDEERAALAQEMRSALVAQLPESVVMEQAAPGVLRLEITVTEINASSPTANVLSTALLHVPLDRGGVAFEARFFDGLGTEPIAVATKRHESSLLSYSGSFSRYGHAIRAFESWGGTLAKSLGGELIAANPLYLLSGGVGSGSPRRRTPPRSRPRVFLRAS